MMYEMRRRKPEPTSLPTQGIFNLPHPIDMIWEELAFNDAVSCTQQWKSKLAEVMACVIEPPIFRLGVRLRKKSEPTTCLLHLTDGTSLSSEYCRKTLYSQILPGIGWFWEFYVLATSKSYQGGYDLWQCALMVTSCISPMRSIRQHHDLISHPGLLSWHWVNQSMPYPMNAEHRARKRPVLW